MFFAQQKYFVYFKDKGIVSKNSFYKTPRVVSLSASYLSEKSIERRKKVLGEDNYIDYDDVPVYQPYKDSLVSAGIKIDKTLNWFNAVSCYLTDSEYTKVSSFSFVDKITTVKSLGVKSSHVSGIMENRMPLPASVLFGIADFDYGNSLSQNSLSDIPKVHNAGYTGNGVLVGILDTGFEFTSPSLAGIKLIAQYDFVNNDTITANQTGDASSQHTHGTAVLSIMAGYKSGYLIGPAYNASFLLAKTENVSSEKNTEEDNYVAALEWMENKGVQITSSSLGYTTFDSGQNSYTYKDMDGKTAVTTIAAEKAFAKGVITLTAAGNEGNDSWYYISSPGDGENIITVGAVTSANIVASYSSHGPTYDGRIKPEICAQGSTVYHANPLSSSYSSGDGTSYATPIAAGICAALLEAHPHLLNSQVRSIIMQSGDNISSPNNNKGYGLLSAAKALSFPNLKNINSVYQVNKMFIGVSGIVSGSVKLNYYVNSVLQTPITMDYDGTNRYTANLPVLSKNDVVKITFTYTASSGSITEPSSGYYYLYYESMNIYNSSYGGTVGVSETSAIPADYVLNQNYPNPFNPSTTITYSLPRESNVTVSVFNSLGQEIARLVNNQVQSAGNHSVYWNGRDSSARVAASGVYFYQIRGAGFALTKKMVLIK